MARTLPPTPYPWPGGSVWEVEGKILYALVRALRPERIVEVGSLAGCSTAHLALACARSGRGTVYAVDPALDFSRLDPALLEQIVPVKEDVFAWTPPGDVDSLFEDGAHTPGFTRGVLERLLPSLAPGAVVLSHDTCRPDFGARVWEEFQAVLGEGTARLLVEPSDCGLALARRPAGEA